MGPIGRIGSIGPIEATTLFILVPKGSALGFPESRLPTSPT
jgi:hypothetical protein